MSVRVLPIGRALRRLSVALTTALAVLMVLSAPSALAVTATPTYVSGDFFGASGSGDGQFQSPGSIAVEPGTHNVLVADTGNARVQVLAPSGNGVAYLTSFGTGTLTAPFGLAIDRTSGAVYVTDTDAGAPVIRRYTSDGAATPTYTLDAGFTSPTIVSASSTLAVDPTTHDLVVADAGTQEVKRFAVSDGHLISSFNGSTSGAGPFTSLRSVAVAPSGTVYVVDEGYPGAVFLDPGAGRVERFDAAGASQGALQGVMEPASVTVAGDTGTALVAWNSGGFVLERRVSLFPGTDVPSATVTIPDPDPQPEPEPHTLGGVVGLAYDETSPHDLFALYDVTLGQFGRRPGVQRLLPGAVPGVEIGPPSSIGDTTAHVTGSVAPGAASGPATVHFEYNFAGGPVDPLVTPDQPGIVGPGETPVSADLAGLRPNTTYSVRLHAANDDFSADSPYATFTTDAVAPGVQDSGVTDRTANKVVVNGRVNPFGQQTTYRFEYGETVAYGSVAPAGDEDVAGNGYAFRIASHSISGLKPSTTYHYRLVAHNETGSSATPDATFTTRPAVEPVRAYEQVSPVDKGGAVLNTFAYYFARADGNALVYQTKNAMDKPETQSSPLQSRYASRRTSTGWDLRPLDAPQNAVPGGELLATSTIAMSPDFSHALVSSNRKLAPGGVEGVGNLYRRDVETGSYELVATGLLHRFISGPSGAITYFGGSPDFSMIAIESPLQLTPDATLGLEGLYQWKTGQGLRLISRMPDGSPSDGFMDIGNRLNWPARNLVTADGSTLYFSTLYGTADGIYRTRNGVTERILDLGPGTTRVLDVTPDGRYLAYVTGPTSDLYRYDTESGVSTFIFSDVSVGGGLGYMGMSENGASIFSSGSDGLSPKVWHDGVVTPIGEISGQHVTTSWGVGVSPNGRYFIFDTTGLDGQSYDNTGCADNPVDGIVEGRCYEVYVYDVLQKKLTCVSCPADGSRSEGHAHLGPNVLELNLRGNRYVNDQGEAFFTTPTGLVAADSNASSDVYMYQDGEVQLISPGKGRHNATLADVSADGSDVFFTTDEQLVGQDRDDQIDMYDARIGGGIAAQSRGEEVAPCGGTECREATPGPTTSPAAASQIASDVPETVVPSAKAKVTVLKVTTTASSLRAKIRVSSRGRVRLSSKAAATKSVTVSRAGTYTIEAKWTKKTRSSQRAKRRVKVTAKISLTPPFGPVAVTSFKRTLGK
jgi:hypothetical protein